MRKVWSKVAVSTVQLYNGAAVKPQIQSSVHQQLPATVCLHASKTINFTTCWALNCYGPANRCGLTSYSLCQVSANLPSCVSGEEKGGQHQGCHQWKDAYICAHHLMTYSTT